MFTTRTDLRPVCRQQPQPSAIRGTGRWLSQKDAWTDPGYASRSWSGRCHAVHLGIAVSNSDGCYWLHDHDFDCSVIVNGRAHDADILAFSRRLFLPHFHRFEDRGKAAAHGVTADVDQLATEASVCGSVPCLRKALGRALRLHPVIHSPADRRSPCRHWQALTPCPPGRAVSSLPADARRRPRGRHFPARTQPPAIGSQVPQTPVCTTIA